jgi:hypothetical protein
VRGSTVTAGKPAEIGRIFGNVVSRIQLGFRNEFSETFPAGRKDKFREVLERDGEYEECEEME